ncbi:MAG: hypothetical protein ACSLE9_03920 [Burkholderiaceae bacterium]
MAEARKRTSGKVPAATVRRPVQLQVNNSGAWKTVTRWDAGNDEASSMVHEAVALLGAADSSCTWRITTAESYPVVLKHWDSKNGWQEQR